MSARYWAVVPAAGAGTRMGADRPKQYLQVAGKRVIEHALDTLGANPQIAGVVVVLAAGDPWWPALGYRNSQVTTTVGGQERCHSVLRGLTALGRRAGDADWVLVHDAARPCLSQVDLNALIDTIGDGPVGGLLGVPVGDTLKRVSQCGEVQETVSRERLWRALTPQMFRLAPLQRALQRCLREGVTPTDECQAIERCAAPGSARPRIVEGAPTNIKVTRAGDLDIVTQYFSRRGEPIAHG